MKDKLLKKLLNFLLQGLLYLAPITITAYIIYSVFTVVDNASEEILTKFFDVTIPGIGILTLILLLIIIGFIGQTFIARPLKLLVRKIIEKVPLLNFIYTVLNDLFSAFIGKEKKFTKPVLVKIDTNSNLERIGFITEENIDFLDDLEKVAVYFPFSYAFTGELLIVSKENIKPIDHNSGDVMKFIVSAGLTGSGKSEK